MSILSTNHRLISIGESYSAGNGIDITDQVISVTGDATPYSAGENIDIQGHIISGKDWSQDITDASSNAYNETTAWVQENYANSADMSYISAAVDTKLDSSAWSTVSGDLATEDYVIMADNINYNRITSYIENKDYANKDFVLDNISGAVSGKLDTTSFSTVSGNFLTAVDLTPYYTTAEAYTLSSMLSGAIDYVSANAGDEFPASANEAIEAYQTNSGTYLTAISIPESASWNDTTDCVQSNSAQWAQGGTIVSPNGTILVNGYNIEASNSAVVETISSWSGLGPQTDRENIGPSGPGTCHITDVESSDSTQLILPLAWNYGAEVVYSANGGATGSFTTTGEGNYTISTPNSTEVDIWTTGINDWIAWNGDITALKDATTTEVMELAPLSALPTYSYDLDDAITGINGSAIGGQGGGVPQSAFDELKASYDALSSLFATYSGQWLLPNEGV